METVEAMILSRSVSIAIGSAVLIVILLGIGLMIARSVTRPIERAVGIAEMIAAGDLTSHIQVRTGA